ncbi:MAG TPA: response regulator transcription factor [Ideonella sp.]|jgi:DNA-binding response OmpR family regulator|uniref:response regulator transcription factor n=1 Tax=Ideonella sp. TaxID=1929293 RepID=UPI002E37225C|nr:response regulator transcription factor [Ideonella sp.]HEX5684565.1 response regulator transcription factor [Ideonella sp.]
MTGPGLHVLLVEDHAPLREQIAALLQRHGHRVEEASDGRQALQMALDAPPDVLLLDIGLPGLDGVQLCRRLRARSARHVPVLMLTARDALTDKLSGFDAGTDDYLVKPFANEELLARVLALGRRGGAGQDYLLSIGSLSIDRRSREAWRRGQRLALPPTAFGILQLLAEAWPRALTRSELIRRLWDDDPPESDPLRTHLYQLRQHLDKPFDMPMLRTVHGVGFRLESDAADSAGAAG